MCSFIFALYVASSCYKYFTEVLNYQTKWPKPKSKGIPV